jgi:collagenase-like PrtC family protease
MKKSPLISGSKRNVQHNISKHKEGNDEGCCQSQQRKYKDFLKAGKLSFRSRTLQDITSSTIIAYI